MPHSTPSVSGAAWQDPPPFGGVCVGMEDMLPNYQEVRGPESHTGWLRQAVDSDEQEESLVRNPGVTKYIMQLRREALLKPTLLRCCTLPYMLHREFYEEVTPVTHAMQHAMQQSGV